MDWFLNGHDVSAVTALRHEISSYLARHAAPGTAVDDAEVAVGEVLANAARHAPGPAWVSLDWSEARPVLTVHDLGPGFELEQIAQPKPLQQGGWGLYIVSHLSEDLSVANKRAGGSRVRVSLPIERKRERSIAPPRSTTSVLPDLDEADESGAFGKEPFLRALVVQLAQSVESELGPDTTERAVAQVGTDVGGQMEEAYRRARDITGKLSPEQIADLYVQLKRAIDGDFYVIEITDERIVLGNRACPFGDVVRRSPALCRMTSSVFGGIAARNTGGAAVQLEERIAVGDPECRVVVWLGPNVEERAYSHRYGAANESD